MAYPVMNIRGFEMMTTDSSNNRRKEQRLRYHWPVWFAEDFNSILSQGQMVDASSRSIAFTCYADGNCPWPGQQITTRFSVPRCGADDSFDIASFTRTSRVYRVDNVNRFIRRVAIQFAEPLPFRPGEQAGSESETQERLAAVVI
jgi:hypothetical protein